MAGICYVSAFRIESRVCMKPHEVFLSLSNAWIVLICVVLRLHWSVPSFAGLRARTRGISVAAEVARILTAIISVSVSRMRPARRNPIP